MPKQRRESGRMRKAYLKTFSAEVVHGKKRSKTRDTFPQGVRVGGQFQVFPYGPASRRISAHSATAEVPPTQTHGKRGLTLKRVHKYLDVYDTGQIHDVVPVPRAQTYLKYLQLKHHDKTKFRLVYYCTKANYELYLMFFEDQWYFFKEVFKENKLWCSRLYTSQKSARSAFDNNCIEYVECEDIVRPPDG